MVSELASPQVIQSATWLTASCFVDELSCKHAFENSQGVGWLSKFCSYCLCCIEWHRWCIYFSRSCQYLENVSHIGSFCLNYMYYRTMKCLVIGGGGFLGQHIVEHLLGKGHSVSVFDLRTTFQNDGVSFFTGDICKKQVCWEVWKNFVL